MNTIIYDELSIPPSEDLETVTRLHLREQCQDLTLEGESGTWVYGNARGHSLLNQMHAWTRRIETLESKERQSTSERRAHERQTEEHKKEILALKRHNGLLMQNSDNYLDIRHRFLETYQRDIMNNPAFRGSAAIKAGNSKAHDGNALADAALYHRDRRSDTRLYRDLYGLDYREVLELNSKYLFKILCGELTKCIDSGTDDGGILLVLNAHATL